MPLVIRIPFGGGIGGVEHHSESPETYFAHTAGLKVVTCSNPVDAYWMIQQAVASDDPVIFFEPKRRYHERAEVDESATPLPLHAARSCARASDVTLLAYGPMVKTCLDAAAAAAEEGRDLEVIDLRSLAPLDMAAVAQSAQQDRPGRRGARGADQPRPGRRAGRPDHRGVLLLPGGAGAAGRRLRHCPTRRAGSRTTTCPTWTGCSTWSTARWPTERGMHRWRSASSACPTRARAWSRPTSSPGGSPSATPSRSTTSCVEIETSKSLVELPSPYAGTVTRAAGRRGRDRRRRRADHRHRRRGSPAPTGVLRPRPPTRSRAWLRRLPAEGDGSGERVADLVGYGPRTTETKRRPRKQAAADPGVEHAHDQAGRHLRHRRAGVPPGRRPRAAARGRPAAADRRPLPAPGPAAPEPVLSGGRGAGQAAGAQAGQGPRRRPEHGHRQRPGRSRHPRGRHRGRAANERCACSQRRPTRRSLRPAAGHGRRPDPGQGRAQGDGRGDGALGVHRAARHRVADLRRHRHHGAARPAAGPPRVRRGPDLAAAARRQGGLPGAAAVRRSSTRSGTSPPRRS